MRKLLLLAALCAQGVWAQYSLTRITGTLNNPDSTPFSGVITISWPRDYLFNGIVTKANPSGMPIYIANGAVDVKLVPSDTYGTQGLVYEVTANMQGKSFIDHWSVPSSASTVALTSVTGFNVGSGGTGSVNINAINAANSFTTIGTGAAYTGSPSVTPTSLQTGQIFYVTFNATSTTTTPTLNINSTGVKNLVAVDGSTFVTTTAISTIGYCTVYYDGTSYRVSGSCVADPTTIPYRCGTAPGTPGTTGDIVTYCDSADGHSKRKDWSGVVYDFQSSGGTPGIGGVYQPFGYASYTAGGTAVVFASNQTVLGGQTYSFIPSAPTIAFIKYTTVAGGAGGTGIGFALYPPNSGTFITTSPVCTGIASGADATSATSTRRVALTCSGLLTNQPYILVTCSDSASISLLAYGTVDSSSIMSGGTGAPAKYRGVANAVCSGSGSGITFNSLSGITWAAAITLGVPLIGLEN